MGIHPETIKVVVADPLHRAGKAEERRTLKRVCLRPPGAQAPACSQEHIHELGRSRAGSQDVDHCVAQAARCKHWEFRPHHISNEAGNDRGAKGVAERESGE